MEKCRKCELLKAWTLELANYHLYHIALVKISAQTYPETGVTHDLPPLGKTIKELLLSINHLGGEIQAN